MIYIFDGCEFNTRLYTIQRGGQATRLRPKVFQVLFYLIEHRDQVVSKQELANHIWPDQFIADSTLESTVRATRQALGDSGREQRLIQTLPGYGYRFIGYITSLTEEFDGDESEGKPALSAPPEEAIAPAAETACEPVHLPSFCPACGIESRPQSNFCSACGEALAPGGVTPEPSTPLMVPLGRGDGSEAERRQLTVMSCELVDTATLLSQLELEDVHDVIRIYQEMSTGVTRHFDGYIAQQLGSKLLIYFGYPLAHEDDAQRAVRAGLAMIESLEELNARLGQEKGVRLAVRLGIHTGLAIVGDLGGSGQHATVAVGEPTHIADQIQSTAPPNVVMISAATERLIQGYFTCQDLGEHRLQGLAEPVPLSRVMQVSAARSRLDVGASAGLTPFVGRDIELAFLLERWAQVLDGSGQVVLLRGDAGIGKSRLVRVMKEHLTKDAYMPLECRCSPYDQQSALYPVIDLLHHILHWDQDDTPAEKLKKLETVLTRYAVSLEENVPLLSAFLSLPCPDGYPPLQLDAHQQRQKTLGAILRLLLALTACQPVLLIVEDLHWADPSTRELLTLIVEQAPTLQLCILLTFRPSFEVPWGHRSYVAQMTLSRLPRQQVEQMVMRVTGGRPLPSELLLQVVDKTDGVPLYIEECTKALLEAGSLREAKDRYELLAPLQALDIPATLHDSLMARLDRLDMAKRVAQVGAVLGRQFSYALLRAIWSEDERLLRRGLSRLVEAELVYQQELPPKATYIFKHALVQETAYHSLLKSTRQQYHRRTAKVLDETFPDVAAIQPELLAYHYSEAGLNEQAIPYWQKAGEFAIERSATAEAINHFKQGLELLQALPASRESIQHELTLQLSLGSQLLNRKGNATPEAKQAYTRARELCCQLGESPQYFSALRGLFTYHLNRASLQTARELGEESLHVAKRLQAPGLLLEAHQMLGSTLFLCGVFVSAREHLEEAIALSNAPQNRAWRFNRGTSPIVVCFARMAWTLWMLGFVEQALTKIHEAINLAQEACHHHSLIHALHYASILYQARGEVQLAKEFSDKVISLSSEQGFAHRLSGALCIRGWALAHQGLPKEGAELISEGLATWQDTGVILGRAQNLSRLAEAYAIGGQAEAGLEVLDEALRCADVYNERYCEAEIYRIKGELLLQIDDAPVEEAQKCFLQAIDIARYQCAKSLELKAATSASRLFLAQGNRDQARRVLTEIRSWFAPDSDTPDIRQAQALLNNLI